MSASSITQKVEIAAGFAVSLSGLLWLLTLQAPREALPRLGFISALFCAGMALAYCWAVSFAFVMRKRRWPARTFSLAGLLFIVPGFVLMWSLGRLWPIGMMFVSWGSIASYITRKLACPKLIPEQIYAPEPPLTLFSN
jgi:Kef-type K+ transport system membrane component KefB